MSNGTEYLNPENILNAQASFFSGILEKEQQHQEKQNQHQNQQQLMWILIIVLIIIAIVLLFVFNKYYKKKPTN